MTHATFDKARLVPLGFFNMAETYWRSARKLARCRVDATHREDPVRFLYYHAIELYLKAFLLVNGATESELASRKFGHHVDELAKAAEGFNLFVMDEDREVIQVMATDDTIIRARYLRVGRFRVPTVEALDRTCKSFRESVGERLRSSGLPVRMTLRRRKRRSP